MTENVSAAAAAKSLQSYPTLCDPIDGSPPGCPPSPHPVPGILQARTLEWVAISFSNAWKGKGKAKSLSRNPMDITRCDPRGNIAPDENYCIIPGPLRSPLRKPNPRSCFIWALKWWEGPRFLASDRSASGRTVDLWRVDCCVVPMAEQVVKSLGDREVKRVSEMHQMQLTW